MVITKQIISKYADAIFDIIKDEPSKENTKNISETLDMLFNEWKKVAPQNDNVLRSLGEAASTSKTNVLFGSVLDLDDDKFVNDLSNLMRDCVEV